MAAPLMQCVRRVLDGNRLASLVQLHACPQAGAAPGPTAGLGACTWALDCPAGIGTTGSTVAACNAMNTLSSALVVPPPPLPLLLLAQPSPPPLWLCRWPPPTTPLQLLAQPSPPPLWLCRWPPPTTPLQLLAQPSPPPLWLCRWPPPTSWLSHLLRPCGCAGGLLQPAGSAISSAPVAVQVASSNQPLTAAGFNAGAIAVQYLGRFASSGVTLSQSGPVFAGPTVHVAATASAASVQVPLMLCFL